jgi:hypothetical protein
MGMNTSMPGQEGIPSVFSPMARTLDDLTYFTREFIKMGPWRYDHTCHPLEWRSEVETEYTEKKVLKVGVMRDDGMCSHNNYVKLNLTREIRRRYSIASLRPSTQPCRRCIKGRRTHRV